MAGVPFALIAVTAVFVRGYSLAIAQRKRITPLVMMMGGVACFGSLIGLLNRNLVGYVIGDTLKMLIVPTQLFCGAILVRRLSEKEIGKLMMIVTWIAVAGAAASLVQWVFHRAVADQASGARLWTIGPWTYNLTAFAGLLATWPRGYILRLAWSSALGLVALVGVVTGYRLIFALYAVICVTYGFWIVPRRYWSRFAVLAFVGLIALSAGATVLIERGRGTHMLERWKILASDPLNDPSRRTIWRDRCCGSGDGKITALVTGR